MDVNEVSEVPETSTSARETRINSGRKFLLDPRVAQSTLSRRVLFLKSKGLSQDEVVECFQRANQPVSADSIGRIFLQEASSVSAPLPATTASYQQPMTAASQQYPPRGPLPPVPQSSWSDVLTRAGMLAVGAYAAFHAFQTYSPYEIRHKDDTTAAWRRRSNARGAQEAQGSARTPAAALPQTPTVEAAVASSDNGDGALKEKITSLEGELTTAKGKVEELKKEKAELAYSQSRLKAQLQQMMRTSEKNAAEVLRLTTELQTVREGNAAPSTAAAVEGSIAVGDAVPAGPPPEAEPIPPSATVDAMEPAGQDALQPPS